jgi:electron transfer flavoprotein beta subunit
LPNIIKAKRKPIRKDTLELYRVQPKLRRRDFVVQATERLRKIFDGKDAPAAAAQLVNSLRNEAGVIQ